MGGKFRSRQLVEREHELACLRSALTDARSERGRVVLIHAHGGTGKSQLLCVAAEMAREGGMRVLQARGRRCERGFPFGLTLQLLESQGPSTGSAGDDGAIERSLREGHDLVSEAVQRRRAPTQPQSFAIIRRVVALLQDATRPPETTEPQPIAIVVDDAHLADDQSLALLAYLGARVGELPIAVIAATRDGALPTAGTALDGLKEAASEAVLAPADLGSAGVASIVRSELGKVTDEVASACAEVTGGNPFLLVELLAEVRRSGVDASSLTASRLLELSPEAVATRIASRLEELPSDARLLAWALAAIDCPASIARCAAVAGIDVEAAAHAADALVESRLLAAELPLRFARPLASRVLLGSIPAGEREQLQRRARETESAHSDSAVAVPPVERPLTSEQHLALAQVAIRSALRGDRRDRVAHLAELAWGDGALLGTRSGEACATATVLAGGLLLVDDLDRSLEIAFHPELRDPRNHPPEIRIAACHSRAWALYHQGRITASLAEAQRTQRVLAQGGTSTDNSLNGVIAVCHIQRGELDEAESALSMLANPDTVAEVDLPTLLDVRAQLRLAQGRPEEALSDASYAGRRLRQLHPDAHPGIVAWRSTAALAMLALGRATSALRLAEEELELAQSVDATRTVIRALRVCGYSTEGEPGLQRLAEAVNAGRGRPLRLEYALALIDLGTAMRHSRRHYIGDGLLRQALRLCERLGATAAAARAREEIEAGAERVRKRKGIGVTALTPSERRVALLAARGATTRQIATELFVTPKAVEFHLRNIYLKLGIPSTRADLARALRSIASEAEDVTDATTPEAGRSD